MAKLEQHEARSIIAACGIESGADFFTLPASTVEALLTHADKLRYRAPKNANGSRGRYFYAYLQRAASGPKTTLLYVVQGNYGQGWEDEAASISYREARDDLKAYRENAPGSHRIIKRRERNHD